MSALTIAPGRKCQMMSLGEIVAPTGRHAKRPVMKGNYTEPRLTFRDRMKWLANVARLRALASSEKRSYRTARGRRPRYRPYRRRMPPQFRRYGSHLARLLSEHRSGLRSMARRERRAHMVPHGPQASERPYGALIQSLHAHQEFSGRRIDCRPSHARNLAPKAGSF